MFYPNRAPDLKNGLRLPPSSVTRGIPHTVSVREIFHQRRHQQNRSHGLSLTVAVVNEQHALGIRPDDVWLAILNAEGKPRASSRWSSSRTRYNIDFGSMSCQVVDFIEKNVADPTLTSSVSISEPGLDSSARATLVVESLRSFPQLDTLNIIGSESLRRSTVQYRSRLLADAFEPYSFPFVTRIVLADGFYPILACFPGVRSLGFANVRIPSLLAFAQDHCPSLEEIVYTGSSHRIAVVYQDIQRLVLGPALLPLKFKVLRKLTNLCYLEFVHREADGLPTLSSSIKGTQKVLTASLNPAPKMIRIMTLEDQTNFVRAETVIRMPTQSQ
ncbi:hypothetical protein B0H17DRAFT_1332965 [Mycena rosella]|uniref:Uncharacterized protein n=1 Tax=Mycena rosella TaxID=1033263 RepID=A0AAD7GDN0_MYCRO|nr:hypothetical protein B0H17DRAFT_1332965 [Mycena rosella]